MVDACLRAAASGPSPSSALLSSNCTFLRPGRIDQGDLLGLADVTFGGRRLICVNGKVIDATGTCLVTGETLLSQQESA
jgi:hypothetical protein